MTSGVWVKGMRAVLTGAMMMVLWTPGQAQAQLPVTVSGGVDIPSLYYFRGARQEADPKLTIQPFVDVGKALFKDGSGALKSVNLNVGSWNSIHTGSNEEFYGGAFFESDLYATVGLGFEKFTLATTYTAYTYPSPEIDAIHEIAFKGTYAHKWAPYGFIAFEFAEEAPGTYLELGVGPSWPLSDGEGAPTLTIPARVAFDVKDYYGGDTGFAYFGIGGTVVIPRGKWSIKLAGDVLTLSDTLEGYNTNEDGDSSKVALVGLVGLGFSF